MAVKALLVALEAQVDLQRIDRVAEQTFGPMFSEDTFFKIIHIVCHHPSIYCVFLILFDVQLYFRYCTVIFSLFRNP